MLTVVVPSRQPGGSLPRTLHALAAQELDPAETEVVVVVDGEGPTEAIEGFALPCELRVIQQPARGQAAARNRGASEARGDRFVFCDDDLDLEPGFLDAVDAALDEADVALADIRIAPWVPDTLVTRAARREEAAWARRRPSDQVAFEVVYFAATGIRRSCFEASGGFDESFTADGGYGNEDIELGFRLLRADARIRHADGAIAWTDLRCDLPTLLRRAEQVGHNDVRLVEKHPALDGRLGDKMAHSRVHRGVGRVVLAAPWLLRLTGPLRWVVGRWVLPGPDGPVRYRLCLALRAAWYWRGVGDAGGRDLALRAWAAAASPPTER